MIMPCSWHPLNDFYARCEAQHNMLAGKTTIPTDHVLCLSAIEIRNTLTRVSCWSLQCTSPGVEVCHHRYLQQLKEPSSCQWLLQRWHYHPCAEEIIFVLPEWLQVRWTHLSSWSEWLVIHKKSSLPTTLDPFQLACHFRGWHICQHPPFSDSIGQKWQLCKDCVHCSALNTIILQN